MATFTRRQWVDQALRYLFVTPAGSTPSAADVATVDQKVEAVIAMLEQQDLCVIPDPEAIEDIIFFPTAVFLADACKYEFGDVALDLAGAENLLRRLNATKPTYRVLEVDYK